MINCSMDELKDGVLIPFLVFGLSSGSWDGVFVI